MQQNIPQNKFRLRITYKKVGVLAYISHLELIKTLEICVRRSGLPYCVSQGYSPHMKISFGSALPVGIESENQIFDVYLTDYIKPAEALCALKESSKNSLEITDCKYVENSELAPSAIFGKTNYCVQIDKKLKCIKIPEYISVQKKGKTKQIELSNYFDGKIEISNENNCTNLKFSLTSFASGSVKPYDFLDGVLKHSGCLEYKIIIFKII